MKIKQSSKHLPFYEQKRLSQDKKVLIALLEEDINFEKRILAIRKNYNIPLKSWGEIKINKDYIKEIVKKFRGKINVLQKVHPNAKSLKTSFKDDLDLIYEDSNIICREYGLPSYWESSILCLICFGVLPFPPYMGPIAYYSQKDFHRWYAEQQENVLIAIEQQISRNQLDMWLDENWKVIERDVKRLPKHPKLNLPALDKYKEIAKLEKEGKTPKEIAEELSNINEDWILSDTEVTIYSNRFKKATKKLRVKKLL
jgi:hypothetical protein